MAKSSRPDVQGELIMEVETLETSTVSTYTTGIEEPKRRVKVQNLFPARVKRTGQVTGEQYVWNGPGTIVEVDARDVEDLLASKVGTTSCCGSNAKGNKVFALA